MTMFEHNNCLIYPLENIIYDERANNGLWCKLPYGNNKNGCPQYPKCIEKRIDFKKIKQNNYKWFAVAKKFSFKKQIEKMHKLQPNFTIKQCRCVYYFQGSIKKQIKETIESYLETVKDFDIILDIPEAHGINVYATMNNVGLKLKANYEDIIYKIMFVGINKGDIRNE